MGYRNAGHLDRALPILLEAVSLGKAKADANWVIYTIELTLLGTVQLESKMWTQAESTLRECLAIQESREPDTWQIFSTRAMLGAALLGQKRFAEAEPLLRAGYEGMARRADKIMVHSRFRLTDALDRLIAFAEATNKPDDAKAWKAERAKWPANPPKPGKEKK